MKQKLIPEGKNEKRYLKKILDGISYQSILKWESADFYRDFTQKYEKNTTKGGKTKKRRMTYRRKKTRKK